jgi:hypothetical protein
MSKSSVAVAVVGLGLALASASPLAAQTAASESKRLELRITTGELVPTGTQRNALNKGKVTAAQLSWAVRPSLAIVGTFGWTRARDIASAGEPKLDVFSYDLGLEARGRRLRDGRAVTFAPIAGFGAGTRSYNYRKLDVDATNNLAAYASAGGDIAIGRLGMRLEARNYVTGFKPLIGSGKSATRNDVVFMAAVRLDRKRASQD